MTSALKHRILSISKKKVGALVLAVSTVVGASVIVGSIGNHVTKASAATVGNFLTSTGTVLNGDSTVTGYSGQVNVTSWSWGGATPVNFGSGAGGTVGKPSLSNLAIYKYLDGSSTQLEYLMTTGTQLPTLTLTSVASVGGGSSTYKMITIKMTKAYVTADSLSESTDRPQEDVTFAYQTISTSTVMLNGQGVAQTPSTYCYNVSTNTSSTSSTC